MPDQEPVPGHSARLLRGLIWAGVVLAPLAAVVVLLGQSSTAVRFAVLLIVVSVVLIGASVLIRDDPARQRADVEERVAEEVASLRRELRSEFGRGGAAPNRNLPPPDESDFFGGAPIHPDEDPFAARPPGSGGRASVPPATAAVRPIPVQRDAGRREPGLTTGERVAAMPPAEPGMSTGGRVAGLPPAHQAGAGGRVVASAAAAVPRGPGAAPRGTQYGRPHALADDFGASDGYAEADYDDGQTHYDEPAGYDDGYVPGGGYDDGGYAAPAGNTYGTTYGGGTTYGSGGDGFPDADNHGPTGGYGNEQVSSGDPNYRARRHRPSANDTNVGTLADYAAMGGYDEPDERYVRGYTGRR